MAKSNWNKVKRGRDVTKILQRNDCPIREGKGSHIIATLPNGDKLPYYHGELSKGVRRKVIKTLVTFGFLLAAFALGGWLALMV